MSSVYHMYIICIYEFDKNRNISQKGLDNLKSSVISSDYKDSKI
jgi:hypothetical protein